MAEKSFPNQELLNHLEDISALRKKFTYDYSIDAIKKLTVEEYCEHEGDKNNFCYRLEHELEGVGHINIYASAFGVKYNKDLHTYRGTKKFSASEDPEEALEVIKNEIVKLIRAGAERDYQRIRLSMISTNIRLKILSVYYPDWYLPIFAKRVLQYFCEKLDIPYSGSEDELILQNKIIQWKNGQPEKSAWSLLLLEYYLYQTFGRPNLKEEPEIEKHDEELKGIKQEIASLTDAISKTTESTVLLRSRDAKIREYALERANGVCELCGSPAPFFKKNGEPYLEVHHIIPLAAGGADSINNVVALCPNCHRKMHSLELDEDILFLKSKAK